MKLNDGLQGSKSYDDFILRVGLITKGSDKLKGLKKLFAPSWLKSLFSLANSKEGIDKVIFYSFFSDDRLKNTSRTHPNSKLIKEINISKISKDFHYQVDTNIQDEVLGIWIAADGDDTNSKFDLMIKSIRLQSY